MDVNSLGELPALETVRDNIFQVISSVQDKVNDSDVVEYALDKVAETKNTLFSALHIPCQKDVDDLTKKLVALEKKVQAIKKHATK